VELDGGRLRKGLAYLIRAMARRCKHPGIYVNTEVVRKSHEQLHVSVHLRGFYDPAREHATKRLIDGLGASADTPPLILGWTEREARIIFYLFRMVGITPVFATLPDGAVSVLLDAVCRYTIEDTGSRESTDSLFIANSVTAMVVSDDPSLSRLTSRADLVDYDVAVVSFSLALADLSRLRSQDALLIDVSDIAAALGLLDELKAEGAAPAVIAICPPGHVSDALSNRLFELGFTALIQKPLQYSRVVQIIRAALADPLSSIHPNSRPIN
jgi:hypothetical protein